MRTETHNKHDGWQAAPAPILFVDHADALGGAERSLLLLIEHLNPAHWTPHLACPAGPLARQAEALGVTTHPLVLPRLRRSFRFLPDWIAGARQLARLAEEVEAAALYANTVRAAVYAAPAAYMSRRPLFWHMRDLWLSEEAPRLRWLDRLGKEVLCRSARRVLVNSHMVAANMPCPGKTTVVHNGIDLKHVHPGRRGTALRQDFSLPPDALLVGTVGRLRPWKGQDWFLRAMARVAVRFPTARFLVVGGAIFGEPPAYADALKRLARDLGLVGRVVFTGHVDDVRPALDAFDVFVHAGDPEPFGLVNIEAMAMGKVVVAFAHGALPEIVRDGETGVLVAPYDTDALAEAVCGLLEDPERRAALGAAGRRRVAAQFTAERMAAGVAAVLANGLQGV